MLERCQRILDEATASVGLEAGGLIGHRMLQPIQQKSRLWTGPLTERPGTHPSRLIWELSALISGTGHSATSWFLGCARMHELIKSHVMNGYLRSRLAYGEVVINHGLQVPSYLDIWVWSAGLAAGEGTCRHTELHVVSNISHGISGWDNTSTKEAPKLAAAMRDLVR